jgi:hypothetical protein
LTLKTGSSFNLKLSRSVSFSIFISTSFRRPSITLIWVVHSQHTSHLGIKTRYITLTTS